MFCLETASLGWTSGTAVKTHLGTHHIPMLILEFTDMGYFIPASC